MNSKLFGVICVSLATSIWFAPTQEALAHGVEFQTNIKQSKALLYEIGSRQTDSSALPAKQRIKPEAQAITQSKDSLPIAAASEATASSQSSSSDQTTQTSNVFGGVFVIFLFIGYTLVGLQYRKYRTHRAAVLLRQIEALERIWNMEPYR